MGCGSSKKPQSDGESSGARASRKNGEAQLLDKYTVSEMLGQGTFGIVYACKPHDASSSTQDCAVKMVDKVETPVEKIREEAQYLKMMEHPNVMGLLDIFFEKCFVCLVMERLRGGDLIGAMQRHWKSKGTIPLEATVLVVRQMGESLKYVHDKQLVHRDVKGDNFLIDRPEVEHPDVRIVLTDFGTVCECPPGKRLHDKCGTKLFWSPEFYSRDYAIPVDIFAMGIVFYGLLNGRFPFRDENEVRNKLVKVSDGMPPECKECVLATLEKSDKVRITAADLVAHAFVKTEKSRISHIKYDPKPAELGGVEVTREIAANGGVLERRQELVERLQDVHMKVSTTLASTLRTESVKERHYWKDKFTIKAARNQGMFVYEWWTPEKVQSDLDVSVVAGSKGAVFAESQVNIDQVGKMLTSCGVDVSKFGVGQAKTLADLAREVHTGAAVMMLDASSHRKVVRVVNIVCLRIKAPRGSKKYLIETGEEWADGRKRSIARLPATKKQPHENTKQTCERIVKETLASFGKLKVYFDWNVKEVYEDEEESPSFPGVRTVYRKEIVEGTVNKSDSLRLSSKSKKSTSDGKGDSVVMAATKTDVELERADKNQNIKFFKWITEKECLQKGIKVVAPAEGMEVSGLVHAPIGMDEALLRETLKKHNIDVSMFGKGQAKSVAELSSELVRGECHLDVDEKNDLTRYVDMVVIKLGHPDGRILVEVEHVHADGKVTALKRLPGAKRRPDENQYLTARRMLKRSVKMEEDHVIFHIKNVEIVEEEKRSLAYPQLRTIYRKRILPASLMVKLEDEVETDDVGASFQVGAAFKAGE